ncbi:MAG: DNA/RNA helicase domain-containing protein [Thermoplasmatota archaeon]
MGVIFGTDLVVHDGRVQSQPEMRARTGQSLRGWRDLVHRAGNAGRIEVDALIKNTYRTLLTRRMKGCYVYCVDLGLAGHIRAHLGQ